MFNFLEPLNDRSTEFQWSDNVRIMMIKKYMSDANTDYVNILTNHSEMNINMITKFEQTHIGKESRSEQDTNILYHCLINSISDVGKYKVSVWNSQYKVDEIPLRNLLLKVIIRESHLDTNVTTTSIRI